jgi:hypothetical protein
MTIDPGNGIDTLSGPMKVYVAIKFRIRVAEAFPRPAGGL